MLILPMFYKYVTDNKLGKDDKDNRVNLKCEAYIWQIVHEKCWLVYSWIKVQSELPCASGLEL